MKFEEKSQNLSMLNNEEEEFSAEQECRQMAVTEVLALKERYKDSGDRRYSFQHDGKVVNAAFVTASIQSPPYPPNGYQIELLTPKSIVVEGECFITDQYRDLVPATGITKRGEIENRIILEVLTSGPRK